MTERGLRRSRASAPIGGLLVVAVLAAGALAMAAEVQVRARATLVPGRHQLRISGSAAGCPVGDRFSVRVLVTQTHRVASGASRLRVCTGRRVAWQALATARGKTVFGVGRARADARITVEAGGRIVSRGASAGAVTLRCPGPVRSTKTQVIAQINLTPPGGHGNAAGVAELVSDKSGLGVVISAIGVSANGKHDAYAVWLYNSPSDRRLLGFVNRPVGRNGRLQTAGRLPLTVGCFKRIIVSLEIGPNPKQPHRIVLSGALSLG